MINGSIKNSFRETAKIINRKKLSLTNFTVDDSRITRFQGQKWDMINDRTLV